MYVDVAFPIPSFQIFTYKVPKELISKIILGSRVKVPFKNKVIYGIIVSIKNNTLFKGNLKSIIFVDEISLINKELWNLAKWVSNYYHSPIGKVIKSILPFNISLEYKPSLLFYVSINKNIKEIDLDKLKLKAPKQYQLFNILNDKSTPVSISELREKFSNILKLCRELEKKNIVNIYKENEDFNYDNYIFKPVYKKIVFNIEQIKANSKIINLLESKLFSSFLLHGVTGSGKTEIYINAVKHCISKGKSAIILLPEIALTPQIAGRFRSVFGSIVALWHSKMTKKQKWITWNKIFSDKYKIVIGARSAVFAPLNNIGLIVVDEEQESSFYQDDPAPRYNARDVALVRGKKTNALVLLSSATPSLDTYYNYLKNKIKYLSLTKRFGNAKYPKVHLVDMVSEQNETGRYDVTISAFLQNKIEEKLEKNEQIILLQNRRGYSPIIRCFECEEIASCNFCKVALSYHKDKKKLICHCCGYNSKIIKKCILCSSKSIRYLGTGTQKVESIIKESFPDANYIRIDTDSSQSNKLLLDSLKSFAKRKYDILIGTQMIAKGLDFPDATLVGIINADIGLTIPDFRSEERVFQLLYQASGRSGRSKKPGDVVIQTFSPDNTVMKYSSMLKIKEYYKLLLKERKALDYPPYSWITKVEFLGNNESYVNSASIKITKKLIGKYEGLNILGPAPCYYHKIRNKYRFQLVFKSLKNLDPNSKKLNNFIKRNFINNNFKMSYNKCKINIYKDPISLV